MIVYRITLTIHSSKLLASGYPARWNSKDVKMIYTAQSRSLACLENVVHRNSKGLQKNFSVMEISVPDELARLEIKETNLIPNWREFDQMPYTQALGDEWLSQTKSVILKIPSAIVRGDSNYLLNPGHKDFKKIKVLKVETFEFEARIKGDF